MWLFTLLFLEIGSTEMPSFVFDSPARILSGARLFGHMGRSERCIAGSGRAVA